MTIGEITALISAATALVAVFIGPWLASRFNKNQLIGPMREKWIQNFRDSLAEMLSLIDLLTNPGFKSTSEDNFEKYHRILLLDAKVRLMLNPGEPPHAELISLLEELNNSIHSTKLELPDKHKEAKNICQRIVAQSQIVIKNAWKQVKNI